MAGRGDWEIEIIKRSDTAKCTFVLLPRRWVVERTFAWLGRNRRLAKDFEATLESSTAWLFYDQNSPLPASRFPLPASYGGGGFAPLNKGRTVGIKLNFKY